MNCKTVAIGTPPPSAFPAGALFVGAVNGSPRRMRLNPVKIRGGKPMPTAINHKNITESAQRAAAIALRNQLVVEHLPLVKAIAVRLHLNLPAHVALEDMIQAGNLGLLSAANKYDLEKKVVFPGYAKHRIRGAILDSLRQLDWASRDMRRHHKQVETATQDLAVTLQRAPVEAEVAEKLGMDVARLRSMMVDLRNIGLISASTRLHENLDLPEPDFPDKPEGQPEWIYARAELRSVLGARPRIPQDRGNRANEAGT
jgi:RNA polymerase sigma factor FliA